MADIRCGNCGQVLPPNQSGPCPKCGATRRVYLKEMTAEVVKSEARLYWDHRHEFVRKNPGVNLIIFILTFGSLFLSLVLPGVLGLLISLVISVICYVIGPFAAERIIQITRGQARD